jgi:hypothetical protein
VLEQQADANTTGIFINQPRSIELTVGKQYGKITINRAVVCRNATCMFTDQMSKYKIGYEIAVWEITMNRAGRPYLRMLSTKIRDERVRNAPMNRITKSIVY